MVQVRKRERETWRSRTSDGRRFQRVRRREWRKGKKGKRGGKSGKAAPKAIDKGPKGFRPCEQTVQRPRRCSTGRTAESRFCFQFQKDKMIERSVLACSLLRGTRYVAYTDCQCVESAGWALSGHAVHDDDRVSVFSAHVTQVPMCAEFCSCVAMRYCTRRFS